MFDFFIASAVAQDASPAQPSTLMNMVPLVLVFVIFYVFILLPQKKKSQQTQSFVKAMKTGDEVFTNSGILGKVMGMNEKIVTLELEGGAKMKVLRSQIGGSSKQILESQGKK